MIVFADTSALFALMVLDDAMHEKAGEVFQELSQEKARLITSSYVILELIAMLQRRVGLDAVNDFQMKIMPVLDVVWVDSDWHARAMQRLMVQRDQTISLVDCLSFEIMEARGMQDAYSFDAHFAEQGFSISQAKPGEMS
jgi:predicted nucleic acid-binding protein